MASYKSKKEDRFLTYLVMGFAGLFVILLFALILINALTDTPEYSDFTHLTYFEEILTKPEEDYLVYYYSETCSHCSEIKDEVLQFADDNSNGYKVYFIDAASIMGTNPVSGMTGTPSMVVVENNAITDLVVGSIEIPKLLEELNAGDYVLE